MVFFRLSCFLRLSMDDISHRSTDRSWTWRNTCKKKARSRRMRKIRNTHKNVQLNNALLWSMKSMSRTKRTERNSMPRQRTAPIPSVRSPDLKLRGSILNCAHFVRWSTSIFRRSKSRFLFVYWAFFVGRPRSARFHDFCSRDEYHSNAYHCRELFRHANHYKIWSTVFVFHILSITHTLSVVWPRVHVLF